MYDYELKKEYILTRQLLRSETSIGANIKEASDAQSKRDFTSKLQISLKEARESQYWINLLIDSRLCEQLAMQKANILLSEVTAMLVSSVKTAKLSIHK